MKLLGKIDREEGENQADLIRSDLEGVCLEIIKPNSQIDKHAPLQRKRSKFFKVPWLSKHIKDLLYARKEINLSVKQL